MATSIAFSPIFARPRSGEEAKPFEVRTGFPSPRVPLRQAYCRVRHRRVEMREPGAPGEGCRLLADGGKSNKKEFEHAVVPRPGSRSVERVEGSAPDDPIAQCGTLIAPGPS